MWDWRAKLPIIWSVHWIGEKSDARLNERSILRRFGYESIHCWGCNKFIFDDYAAFPF